MTYPMPPELLDQLGLEPYDESEQPGADERDELGRPGSEIDRYEEARAAEPSDESRARIDLAGLYSSLNRPLALIVARRVAASSAVIEEACQFAWYRLVVCARRIDPDAALPWLSTTAIHEAIKLARRDQRELSLEARVDQDGELNLPSATPQPAEQTEWRERLAQVRRLPVRQQRFLWKAAAGYSHEEIAGQEAGLTKRTVERQIQRARRKLNAAA